MDHKDEDGRINSATLDNLLPGEPFHVLRGSHPYSLSLVRRKLKRGLREGIFSQRQTEELRETIKTMMVWPKDG